jgi:hypothetical protein
MQINPWIYFGPYIVVLGLLIFVITDTYFLFEVNSNDSQISQVYIKKICSDGCLDYEQSSADLIFYVNAFFDLHALPYLIITSILLWGLCLPVFLIKIFEQQKYLVAVFLVTTNALSWASFGIVCRLFLSAKSFNDFSQSSTMGPSMIVLLTSVVIILLTTILFLIDIFMCQ